MSDAQDTLLGSAELSVVALGLTPTPAKMALGVEPREQRLSNVNGHVNYLRLL